MKWPTDNQEGQWSWLRSAGLIYLATPYTNYHYGHYPAYCHACRLAGRILREKKAPVYSPISHGHGIAEYGKLDQADRKLWLPYNDLMLDKADVLLIGMLVGWRESEGIEYEIKRSIKRDIPIGAIREDSLTLSSLDIALAACTARTDAN